MAKGRDRPKVNPMVHPPIVTLMFIMIAYFLGRFVPLPFSVPAALFYAGLAMAFIGFLFGMAAFIEFRKVHTTQQPSDETVEEICLQLGKCSG